MLNNLITRAYLFTRREEGQAMEADVVTLQDIFVAAPPDEAEANASSRRILSPLHSTGLKPHFLEKLAANNVVLPPSFFTSETGEGSRPTFASVGFGGAYE